ncbi:MAG TPA: thymidylate kinase [Ktedonobacteraceae bacterium]|nr:thymidylate kinase [Ktedonobacteraceae bacterium]
MAEKQYQTRQSEKGLSPMIAPEQPRLIVLEGIDLSGRTTQVQLLHDWLLAQRYRVTTTAWRTSPLISDILIRARNGPMLRPLTYSLLYSADHFDRTQRVIKPALARGEIVLADRYTYTAFARDSARGLDLAWVQNVYHYSVQPDIVFYLHISPAEAVKRRVALQQQRLQTLHKDMPAGKQGKAGKDTKDAKKSRKPDKASLPVVAPIPALAGEALESFHDFEMKMYAEYQQMQKTFGFTVIEGSQPIDQVQAMLRRAVMRLLLNI